MRLIDADKIIERLSGKGANDLDRFVNERMVYLLNNEPTAYDIDKVVEQLEELSKYEVVEKKFEKAIEIVKGGAV